MSSPTGGQPGHLFISSATRVWKGLIISGADIESPAGSKLSYVSWRSHLVRLALDKHHLHRTSLLDARDKYPRRYHKPVLSQTISPPRDVVPCANRHAISSPHTWYPSTPSRSCIHDPRIQPLGRMRQDKAWMSSHPHAAALPPSRALRQVWQSRMSNIMGSLAMACTIVFIP